ncbi:MAG: SsrA-binding protein SmpB [Anaerolineales bacterium]
MAGSDVKTVATNRKASHDYLLEDRFEAGIVLTGSEIKSIRARQVSLKESHVQIDSSGAWLVNAHIAPYDPANQFNHDPRRRRKLLLHRREIDKLYDEVRQRGYTIVPTRLYLKSGLAKVEIALAKGKRKYDKRRELAKKAADREIERALSRKKRGND